VTQRILVVYGTRREGLVLTPVAQAFRQDADFELRTVLTAPQPYRFRPDYPARLMALGMKAKLELSKKALRHGFQ